MATEESLRTVNLLSDDDHSSHQYHAVKVADENDDGDFELCAEGDAGLGILQDKPSAEGEPGLIGTHGRSKAKAGAAFGKGVALTPGSSGKLVAAGTGDVPFATSLEVALADGDIVSVFVNPQIPTI